MPKFCLSRLGGEKFKLENLRNRKTFKVSIREFLLFCLHHKNVDRRGSFLASLEATTKRLSWNIIHRKVLFMRKLFMMGLLASNICVAGEVCIVAHRGESSKRPENTMPAFELAWESGTQYVEGDFHSIQGGEVVCVHAQKEYKNLYGGTKKISEMTMSDFENAKLSGDKWKDFKGTLMPSLMDVCMGLPFEKTLVLEIKGMDGKFMDKVWDARNDNGISRSRIIFIAFNIEHLKAVKENSSRYKCLWLYSLNEKTVKGKYSPEEVIKLVKKYNLEGVDVGGTKHITKEYVDAFKKAGLTFWTWTVDDIDEAKRLAEIGVEGITTNKSIELREAFGQK